MVEVVGEAAAVGDEEGVVIEGGYLHTRVDEVARGLVTDTVELARKQIEHLLTAMTPDNATRVLRTIGDIASKHIDLIVDLDPAQFVGMSVKGPRIGDSGGNLIGYGGSSYIGPVEGGMNNETFGAQALQQLVALGPKLTQSFNKGKNVQALTSALRDAKEANLSENLIADLEAQIREELGTAPQREMPEPVAPPSEEVAESSTHCMYCGASVSKHDDFCSQCSNWIGASEAPSAEVG